MAMLSSRPSSSTLNPNAPFFVPAAFLAAENFSPEWWRLVQSSPAFRDYWLQERFVPPDQDLDLLPTDLDLDFALDDAFLSDDETDLGPGLSGSSAFCKQEENIPPSSGASHLDLRALVGKGGLQELSSPKQRRPQFTPASQVQKTPQIVLARQKKSALRKIQQPR